MATANKVVSIAPMRRAPVKRATVVLAGDYPGWTCQMRTNPRFSALNDLQSGDFDRVGHALASLCIEWDFVDEDGQPLRQPANGGISDLTSDLMAELMARYVEHLTAAAALPKV